MYAVGTPVGTPVGTTGHSTGVLLDIVQFSGYSTVFLGYSMIFRLIVLQFFFKWDLATTMTTDRRPAQPHTGTWRIQAASAGYSTDESTVIVPI